MEEQEKVIKENDNYILRVGLSSGRTNIPCYQIFNKEYGVVEAEYFLLPAALVNFDEVTKVLGAYHIKQEQEVAALFREPKGNVVPLVKEE